MTEIWVGFTVGLAAGITPGPLFALVVTASLRRGFWAGAKVATAPLVSDLPVVLTSIWVIASLSERVVSGLGLVGGIYLIFLSVRSVIESLCSDQLELIDKEWGRAVLVNLLSPHPWVFWITIGAPLVRDADSGWVIAGFLAVFYVLLVGGKVAIAALVAKGSQILTQQWRNRLELVTGILLGVIGVWLGVSYGTDLI